MKLAGKRIGKGIIGRLLLFAAFLISAAFLVRVVFPTSAIGKSPVEKIGPILFVSTRDGSQEIYAMDVHGGNVRKLTNCGAQGPRWSPNGKKILFHAGAQIYTMNPDGSNVTNISGYTGNNLYPDWSPNGKKIVFRSSRDNNGEIYVMDADGSNQTRLTDNSAEDIFPAWSPDGSKIAFVSTRDDTREIYTMNPDGTDVFNVTVGSATGTEWPAWSPDSEKIAFASGNFGFNGINIINSDGTGRVALTNRTDAGGLPDRWPAWSSDGEKIIYGSNVAVVGYKPELFTISVDGSNKRQLTHSLLGVWNHSPDWGRHAFVLTPGGGILNRNYFKTRLPVSF